MNKLSSHWVNYTTDIFDVSIAAVAWETIAKEVIQLTSSITVGSVVSPATYNVRIHPVNLNDKGASTFDVVVGYGFMSYFGDIYAIIAVNDDNTIDISDTGFCGYGPPCGRPAMIFNLTAVDVPPPVIETRWVEEDLSCVMSGADNTGEQIGWSRKQKKNATTEEWEYTGEETAISRTNYSACPPPVPPAPDPFFYAVCVNSGDYDQSNEVILSLPLRFKNPTKAGQNYIFFSMPTVYGKPNIVNVNLDLTDQFDSDGTDTRSGFQQNTIWKRKSTFGTSLKTLWVLTL